MHTCGKDNHCTPAFEQSLDGRSLLQTEGWQLESLIEYFGGRCQCGGRAVRTMPLHIVAYIVFALALRAWYRWRSCLRQREQISFIRR